MLGRISPVSAPGDWQKMVLLLFTPLQSVVTKSLSWCQVPA